MQAIYDREIEQNYQFFQSFVASLLPEKMGHYALLHGRTLIGVYPRVSEATTAGHDQFADGMFSVQKVTDKPLDLGFLSHASDDWITA